MTLSVLVTHHRTVVFVDGDGRFRHRPPELGSSNLVFDPDEAPSGAGVLHTANGVDVVRAEAGAPVVMLRTATGWLSATPDGYCVEVEHPREWETFDPLPVHLVQGTEDFPVIGLPQKQRAFAIPRLLHQTFATSRIPERFQPNVAQLRADNPGWSYMLWDDKDAHDFINQSYGWSVLKYYLRINPRYGAAKADLFRYLLIYQLGGVYLDIKSSCGTRLDDAIRPDDQYLLAQWDHVAKDLSATFGLWPELAHVAGGEFQQWHVIAAPGHPFLEQVIIRVLRGIHSYNEIIHGVGSMATLRITGPIAYTLAIDSVLSGHPHRIIPAERNPFIYINVDHYHSQVKSYRTQTTPLIL